MKVNNNICKPEPQLSDGCLFKVSNSTDCYLVIKHDSNGKYYVYSVTYGYIGSGWLSGTTFDSIDAIENRIKASSLKITCVVPADKLELVVNA